METGENIDVKQQKGGVMEEEMMRVESMSRIRCFWLVEYCIDSKKGRAGLSPVS